MELKQYYVMEYLELETLIATHYGRELDFLVDQESPNYIMHHFVVKPIDKNDWKYVFKWALAGEEGCYVTSHLLNALAALGCIPIGDYLVKVYW